MSAPSPATVNGIVQEVFLKLCEQERRILRNFEPRSEVERRKPEDSADFDFDKRGSEVSVGERAAASSPAGRGERQR